MSNGNGQIQAGAGSQQGEIIIEILAGGIPVVVKESSLWEIKTAGENLLAFVETQERRAMVAPTQDAAIPAGQAPQEERE